MSASRAPQRDPDRIAEVVEFIPRAELIECASDSWTSDEEGFALALSWPRPVARRVLDRLRREGAVPKVQER